MNRAERRRLEKQVQKEPVYTLTRSQLELIKQEAILAKREELKASIAREIEKKIDAEWEEREKALSGETDEERMLKVLALLMSVPAKVLCEKFKWKPITDENDRRSRLLQFSEAVVEEVNRICGDEMTDIRAVAEEAYKKYGVKYEVSD